MTDRYTYRVIWSDEDGEYVGLCSEFPLLSHLDETPEKAFAGIRDLVAFCVMTTQRERPSQSRYPPPLTAAGPCPRTNRRARALAIESAEMGVSMPPCDVTVVDEARLGPY